jgi:hypothetical protein
LTNARESETDFEALCVLLSDTYEHVSHAHAGKDTEPPVMWADTAMHHRVAIRAALRAVLVELGLTPRAGIVIAVASGILTEEQAEELAQGQGQGRLAEQ